MSDVAGATIKSMAAHERKAHDAYPTEPVNTQVVVNMLRLGPNDRVWEPACGEGDMARALTACGATVWASDIQDTGFGTPHIDFLEGYGPADFKSGDWIITNPPFDKAHAFMERALEMTPNVAMLTKSTFWNVARNFDLFHDNPPAFVVPLTWRPVFLRGERGDSPLMDCIWTIWHENRDNDYPAALFHPVLKPYKYPDVSEKPLRVRLRRLEVVVEEATDARTRG